MKKYILAALTFCVFGHTCIAQDSSATINSTWHIYAADTSLTFDSITHICDSMFALAGYPDTTVNEQDSLNQYEDGSPYVRSLWSRRPPGPHTWKHPLPNKMCLSFFSAIYSDSIINS